MKFYSQSDQDKWVCDYLKYKTNGYFIDVGAYDGIQTSNTYTLEKYLNWQGICIEANSSIFNSLQKNRTSKNYNVAVTSYRGYCAFGTDKIAYNDQPGRIVNCDTLNSILEEANAKKEIDYLSMDIEGEEYNALKNFDFNKWEIKLITIEHNLYIDGPEKKDKLYELLTNNNFIRVVEDVKCLDRNPAYYNMPYEDWYVNKEYLK